MLNFFFFFQAEDGIRDLYVTGVQTCALPIYDDGRPGELFITMAKEGSTVGGLMDAFGTAVSMSLQYGVPLEVYVNKFSHMRFEPMGHTKNPDIRIAKSIIDYIFRWLGITFLPGYREAQRGLLDDEAHAPAIGGESRVQ